MESREKLTEYLRSFNGPEKEKETLAMLSLFDKYMEGILDWNRSVNITSITDRDEFIKKHFIDSIIPAFMPEMKAAETITDVGTGGGFPGVPLAIMFPGKKFILIDSLKKRLRIIDDICENIGIVNVETFHGRAEDLAAPESRLREISDICVSRAVADMSILSEYCIPFVKKGGYFLAYKTGGGNEIKNASNAIGQMGGKVVKTVFPDSIITDISKDILTDDNHCFVLIKKVKNTPHRFPRRAGIPAKKPL